MKYGVEEEIVEAIHSGQVEGRAFAMLYAAIKRSEAEDLIMQQYVFRVIGRWILAQADARSPEADNLFDTFRKWMGHSGSHQ